MNISKILLFADSIINLTLGAMLIFFTNSLISFLGVPVPCERFYPGILGAVLFGIGIALLIEAFRKSDKYIGLGAVGAASINLSGALVLAFFLIFGDLEIPLKGNIFLWSIFSILVIISSFEIFYCMKNKI